ncbi:MAG TPA: lysylphosphatidylglycerol synthase transmembrane domain-containing protein, partial [candidate division Zixibacteria bacterium]|nr:lysylphosphatidylglycerol synthase transmembrane domain-containing protein [candidate division Zixibacteria bacterium]
SLLKANYWWLIPNILLILVTMYQRAFRWRSMARPIKEVAFDKLLSATAVGFMANNVLPLRLGEFVRAYSLSKQDPGISKSASMAMIVTERLIFDMAVLIGIFGVALWTTNMPELADQRSLGALLLALSLSGYVFAVLMAKWPRQVSGVIGRGLAAFPDKVRQFAVDIIHRFADGLQFMRSPSAGVSTFAQTVLIWIVLGLSNYFVFLAFDLDVPLEASFVTLVIVSIAISAPSTPGFVGVYHAGVILALGYYGVDSETALACAFIMHATQYVGVTLYGLYHLKKGHLSLKEAEQAATSG